MKISTEADRELKSVLGKPENKGKSARVVVSGFSCCGPKFAITIEEKKPTDDVEINNDMYSVVYEKKISSFLENATIEYKETWSGEKAFSVAVETSGGCCG